MRDLKFYLTVCAELWEWLAENPEREKWLWPGWKKYGINDDCPICEYVFENRLGCGNCPLSGLWEGHCCDENSPYLYWRKGTDRVENALKIACYCRKLIKELEAK